MATLEHWHWVTIKSTHGEEVDTGDNAERRKLLGKYRASGELFGYYLGDEDESAEDHDGSTAGPGVDEIDWAGF